MHIWKSNIKVISLQYQNNIKALKRIRDMAKSKDIKQRPIYYPRKWDKKIDKRIEDIGEASFTSYVRRLILQDIHRKQSQHAS